MYIAVFNMQLLHDEKSRQQCLGTLHKWLSMVWINSPKAPLILVGTHKDKVPNDRRTYEVLSEYIADYFQNHFIYPYIIRFREPSGGSDGGGGDDGGSVGTGGGADLASSLTFFPVDNTMSDGEGNVDSVLKAVRSAVQEAIEDPANVFTSRLIPNSWYELHELMQIEAEEKGLKRVTRKQVVEWAAQCSMGRQEGISLEAETDGFLQLMNAYGLAVWYGEPQLRGVVVLDPQWLVDAHLPR